MTIRSIALAGVAALACAPALATTFAYDNGVTTVAVGPPSSFPVNPVTGWGNYFMSDVGGTKITSVSCAFGPSFSVTTPVTIYLFADRIDHVGLCPFLISVKHKRTTYREIFLSCLNIYFSVSSQV